MLNACGWLNGIAGPNAAVIGGGHGRLQFVGSPTPAGGSPCTSTAATAKKSAPIVHDAVTVPPAAEVEQAVYPAPFCPDPAFSLYRDVNVPDGVCGEPPPTNAATTLPADDPVNASDGFAADPADTADCAADRLMEPVKLTEPPFRPDRPEPPDSVTDTECDPAAGDASANTCRNPAVPPPVCHVPSDVIATLLYVADKVMPASFAASQVTPTSK
jgi:hypothetical protein